ncbi:MAG: DUF6709 family protein [Suilimivivens sp.]
MLERLKKRSVKKILPSVIVLMVMGLALIGIEFSNLKSLMRGHVKFETLEPDEINEDLIVDASIDINFGAFIEEYEENTKTHITRTTNLYYVIWTGDENSEDYKYMGIKVSAVDESKMEAMAVAAYNYEYSDPIQYSGAINRMSSEEYEYFKDYFLESGWTEEEVEEYTLPYYISVGALTGGAASSVYVIIALGGIFILAGLIALIYAMAGGGLSSFKKQMENSGLSEMDVEYEYESARVFNKKNDLRIGKRLTFFLAGSKPRLIVNDQIIWAYQQNTTHRTNGIKTGTSYQILVYQMNSKKASGINIPNETVGGEILKYMIETMPRAVVGYSDELMKLYRKNYQDFLQLRYYRTEQPADVAGARYAEETQNEQSMTSEQGTDIQN